MTAPAIIPIRPGEKPTEPGWYVAHRRGFEHYPMCVSVGPFDGRLVAQSVGVALPDNLANFVFIARIYPERIEAEA